MLDKLTSSNLRSALRYGLGHVPGFHEAWWTLADIRGVGQFVPHSFKPVLRQWLEDLHQAPPLTDRPSRRVLCFASWPWVDLCVATSIMLCSRNCHVDLAWLDQSPDLDCSADDGVLDAKLQHRHYLFRFARTFQTYSRPPLRFFSLSHVVPGHLSANLIAAAHKQSQIDVLRLAKKEHVDIQGVEKTLFERRLRRNRATMTRIQTALCQGNYDSILIPNGRIFETGAVYQLAASLGVPTTTFDYIQAGRLIISNGSCVMDSDISHLWAADLPHILSEERRERVQHLLDMRQQIAPPGTRTNDVFQPAAPVMPETLRHKLHLMPGKPLVLICPNVPFDSSFLGHQSLFPAMSDWLIQTTRYLSNRPDLDVVIRAHPAELIWEPPEDTVERILCRHGLLQSPHIHFIAPADPINTYSLMRIADLGLVYSSTTGMEMALFGMPVVCGNFFHYNHKGFTFDLPTRDAYFATIDQLLAAPQRLTPRQIELAWCYVDLYFNQWPHPFPWTLGSERQDLTVWPMQRVLAEDGQAMFGETFDLLAGR